MRRCFVAIVFALIWPSAASAGYLAGVHAYNSGDYETAIAELAPLAEQGNSGAQYLLAQMLKSGRGLERDPAQAVRWLRLSAEGGDERAQIGLGLMYEYGEGVDPDAAEAARLYGLAAEHGEPFAQVKLGVMRQEGVGVAQDYGEARRLYEAAAARDDVYAQRNLGFLYEYGLGVARDLDAAESWYRAAITRGYPGAMNNLAWMLAVNGLDLAEALDLANRAVAAQPSPAYLDTLGWVHFKRGEFDLAATYLERSIDMFDGDWSAIERLGDVYARLGRADDARAQWRRALEMAEPQAAREALQRKLGES